MAVANYNLKQVIITVAGVRIQGFGENDALRIEPVEDVYQLTVGSDGEKARSRMNNDSKTATMTLLSTSDANDALQAALSADQISGIGLFPFTVEDVLRGEALVCPDAFIMREPTKTYARKVGDREWRLCLPTVIEEPLSLDFLDLFAP